MAAKTRYVILKASEPGTWEQLPGEYEGVHREDAIEAAVKKLSVEDGRFVAIPVSSWSPGKVNVEIATKVTVVPESPARKRARKPVEAATG
jgi:hypothetical protein